MAALERSLAFRLTVWRIAPRLMRVTGGRLARTLPFPADVIETRDTRNGRAHRRVVVYFHDGERVTVIPSKAGMPEDPFWYKNALADPNVTSAASPSAPRPSTTLHPRRASGASPIAPTRRASPTARSPHAMAGRSRSCRLIPR